MPSVQCPPKFRRPPLVLRRLPSRQTVPKRSRPRLLRPCLTAAIAARQGLSCQQRPIECTHGSVAEPGGGGYGKGLRRGGSFGVRMETPLRSIQKFDAHVFYTQRVTVRARTTHAHESRRKVRTKTRKLEPGEGRRVNPVPECTSRKEQAKRKRTRRSIRGIL